MKFFPQENTENTYFMVYVEFKVMKSTLQI